ncbi:hypothetical protein SLITO_v1c07150 [Spiroplasma litorale]|uniref:HTH rpiR-type domain-containing protein n=1 Tax=Spiroplasma litorale TaxID=216942 RepID=A0A0K1W1Z8_9MOLU|nr:hypothetical protein [Spiroplasma litorale]AKX34340.1 hypothetical protein SLITO_v1c07150 [Spiroplasma litorale]
MHIYEILENMAKDNKNTTKQIISKKILEMFLVGSFKSQKEFSKDCFVSESTITRFSQETGCSGYRELLTKLKMEYERIIIKTKNDLEIIKNKKNIQVFDSVNTWVIKNEYFIKELINDIKINKKVRIFSSYQAIESSDFIYKIIQSKNIYCELINIHNNFMRDTSYLYEKDVVNIVILTGRDVETLINFFINRINENSFSKNYIITSIYQKNKIDLKAFKEKCILNFEGDNSQFVIRHFALIYLFTYFSIKFDT